MSKELDIDWSKAPEGATQYAAGDGKPWEKVEGEVLYFWNSLNSWTPFGEPPKNRDNIFYRPADPQWDGKGLPPVGTICQMVSIEGRKEGVIKCHLVGADGSPLAAIQFEKGYGIGTLYCFRPIKSEREKAIDEMKQVYSDGEAVGMGGIYALYAAGWRKP